MAKQSSWRYQHKAKKKVIKFQNANSTAASAAADGVEGLRLVKIRRGNVIWARRRRKLKVN